MVTVVNVPAPRRGGGGGGGGGGIMSLIAKMQKKAEDKKNASAVQDYIDQLEGVKAKGGSKADASDIEIPAFLLKSSQGIGTSMSIQNSIFGSTEQDKLTAFFDSDKKLIGDFPRSQRPDGGQTLGEMSTKAAARAGFKPTENDKVIGAMYRRELSRRNSAGLSTDAKTRGQLRGSLRVWNANKKDATRVIGQQYGKPHPTDPDRYIYDTRENENQALTAQTKAFEHFTSNFDDPPTFSESLAFGISETGDRIKREEDDTAFPKSTPAIESIGATIKEFFGGEDTSVEDATPKVPAVGAGATGKVDVDTSKVQKDGTPMGTPKPTVSFGTVDGRAISIPAGMDQAKDIQKHLMDNESMSQEQAVRAIQDYAKPFTPKKDAQ